MKTIKLLGQVSLWGLTLISLLLFVFALFSGAEENTFQGLLKNSPNALPWLIMLAISLFGWKHRLVTGIAALILGTFFIVFLAVNGSTLFVVYIVVGLIPMFGGLLVGSHYAEKSEQD